MESGGRRGCSKEIREIKGKLDKYNGGCGFDNDTYFLEFNQFKGRITMF